MKLQVSRVVDVLRENAFGASAAFAGVALLIAAGNRLSAPLAPPVPTLHATTAAPVAFAMASPGARATIVPGAVRNIALRAAALPKAAALAAPRARATAVAAPRARATARRDAMPTAMPARRNGMPRRRYAEAVPTDVASAGRRSATAAAASHLQPLGEVQRGSAATEVQRDIAATEVQRDIAATHLPRRTHRTHRTQARRPRVVGYLHPPQLRRRRSQRIERVVVPQPPLNYEAQPTLITANADASPIPTPPLPVLRRSRRHHR